MSGADDRDRHIAALAERVHSGDYEIDAELVAASMIEFHRGLGEILPTPNGEARPTPRDPSSARDVSPSS